MAQEENPSAHVRAAIIGGAFVIIAAVIGGIFLLINTLLENGVIITAPTIGGPGVQVGGLDTQPRSRAQSTSPETESYDCTMTVSASRPLIAHGSGEACWLQLVDGSAAEIVFNDAAQITYRTSSGTDDIYFYVANVGDRLADVVGATIRPHRFVFFGYGSYEEVKQFEIEYHSPSGQWVACLRDANNNYQPLNSVCK